MDLLQTIVLALIQGITEFLPISSSAHLILVPKLTHWADQGLAFDVALHLGTLSAVVFYYRGLLKLLWSDFIASVVQRQSIGQSQLAWGVLLGTIPVGLAGLFFKDFITLNLRSIEVIAYSTIAFGLLLGLADYLGSKNQTPKATLSWFAIVFIGAMQMLALIPGTSRSGIVITAGLLVGLSRSLSVQFGFLLSIPVIILSAFSILLDIYSNPQISNLTLLFVGFLVSAISSYLVVFLFIKTIEKIGLLPFVLYRLLLGVGLLLL